MRSLPVAGDGSGAPPRAGPRSGPAARRVSASVRVDLPAQVTRRRPAAGCGAGGRDLSGRAPVLAGDGILGASKGTRRRAQRPPGRNAQEFRAYARDRLIESRLTPNAISMVGFVLNLVAAVLVTQRLFFLAGVAFIVGSVMDTLDGRYSRMSGKGTLFGAFLDSTLDRIEEGDRAGRGRRLLRRAGRRLRRGDVRDRRARLADGLLHAGPGRGARGRVQGRIGDAAGQGGDTFDRPRFRQGRRTRRFRVAGTGDLRDGRPDLDHGDPARLARPRRARRRGADACDDDDRARRM